MSVEKLKALVAMGNLVEDTTDRLQASIDIAEGVHDEGLTEIYREYGLEDEKIKETVEYLKKLCSSNVQKAVKVLKEIIEEENKIENSNKFYTLQSQHESGLTTAQIAEKLGVSKKQVRRMKANGTLEDALKQEAS